MLGGNLRGWEWVILLVIVLLLFGAKRLPDLARSVGRSMKIFRSEVKDLRTDDAPAAGSVPPATGKVPPVGSVPPATSTETPSANRTRDDSEPLGS